MDNYRSIANQAYNTLGREIDLQLRGNPESREIRFVKVAEMHLMYNSYALVGDDIPAVDHFDFIDAAPRQELADLLSGELRESSLPQEVRVIRPNHERDSWGIFFRR